MRKSDAYQMLRESFGPGDLAEEIENVVSDLSGKIDGTVTESEAEQLIDWIAEQLADEEE